MIDRSERVRRVLVAATVGAIVFVLSMLSA